MNDRSDLDRFAGEVRAARARIRDGIRRTPLEFSPALSEMTGARVFVKWECEQTTGSFKLRGALNKLRVLSPSERAAGVVSASTGNHGLAIGHASRLEGVDLKLFLPTTAAEVKRKKIESLGIPVELEGTDCGKTEAFARGYAARNGKTFVSPYNDRDIVRGAATVGLEVAEDIAASSGEVLEDVVVPCGGGGLVGGIAAFFKAARPAVRTTAVEPETSAFMAASVASGRIVEVGEGETIADAVAGGIEPGSITFPLCRDHVDRFLLVPEGLIVRAMGLLEEHHGVRVEGAGALPLAAVLLSPGSFRGRTVVTVVSGKNIDPERFRAATA
jgi:threonine dehydratase